MGSDLLHILQLLALFYPISASVLAQMRKPMALIVSETSIIQPLIRYLKADRSVITENTSMDNTVNILQSTTIAPIICIGRNQDKLPQRAERQLRLIIDATRLSEIEGRPIWTQIFFVFHKRIPSQLNDEFFKVYIDETDLSDCSFSGMDLLKYEGACVDNRIVAKLCNDNRCDNLELQALYVVIDLARVLDETVDSVELKSISQQVVTYDEQPEDYSDVTNIFRNTLYALAEKSESYNIFKLPNLETSITEQLDKAMFFNDTYLYISDNLFRKITEEMREIFPPDIIKSTLQKDSVLIGGRDRYVTGMSYVTPYGESKRTCMLRFSREKLNKLGEQDLVETCLSNKEDKG